IVGTILVTSWNVAETPVFCAPPPGPTENTTVSPVFNVRLVLKGTSCPSAVTVEVNRTVPFCTTATTVPMPYWSPRKLDVSWYVPAAGAVNIRLEYWPPIPATSMNWLARKSTLPLSNAEPLLYSAAGDVPVFTVEESQYWALGPLTPF